MDINCKLMKIAISSAVKKWRSELKRCKGRMKESLYSVWKLVAQNIHRVYEKRAKVLSVTNRIWHPATAVLMRQTGSAYLFINAQKLVTASKQALAHVLALYTTLAAAIYFNAIEEPGFLFCRFTDVENNKCFVQYL
ncbi:unnamed protein product [Colias eurytheme]|nr:unnamed protein product [Colias eurytheme]